MSHRSLKTLRPAGRGRRCLWLAALAVCASVPRVQAAEWVEDFSADPALRGWSWWGDPALFQWRPASGAMHVTWDSSTTNCYFYRPLGTILTQDDDFRLQFELELEEIAIGVDPEKPYTFELAIGFIGLAQATQTNFFRGSGIHSTHGPRNLVELDYFPDSGFGATVAPTVVSTNNRIAFSDNHPLELMPGHRYRFEMTYQASDQMLRTTAWRDGEPFGLPPGATLADLDLAGFPDFRVDTVAVCNYSDAHQSPPQFQGSLRARGILYRVEVRVPDPPLSRLEGRMEDGNWRVTFEARSQWTFVMERSGGFEDWEVVDTATPDNDGPATLVHSDAASLGRGFYRVRAERP